MRSAGITVFKLTDEDWHPSFQMNGYYRGIQDPKLVKVSVFQMSSGDWRVCVWGADDFGMEHDYTGHNAGVHAMAMFNHLIALDKIRVTDLDHNGFQRA